MCGLGKRLKRSFLGYMQSAWRRQPDQAHGRETRSTKQRKNRIRWIDRRMPEMPQGSTEFLELNAEQLAVVEHGEGPLLVVAGAGTGKTRVITRRICRLLEMNPELSGENILGLTFTDKAANEMKSRVTKAAGARAEGVWLSTFHKFCMDKILLDSNAALQVIEPVEHWILLRRNIRELALKHFTRLAEP